MSRPKVQKTLAVKIKKSNAEDPEAPLSAVVGKAFWIVRKDVGAIVPTYVGVTRKGAVEPTEYIKCPHACGGDPKGSRGTY